MPGIVFISADLFFTPQVQAAATQAGLQFWTAHSRDALSTSLQTESVSAIVVDLGNSRIPLEAILDCRNELAGDRAIRLVAFGPHVQEQALTEARNLGCDEVLTKGQFSRNLVAIVKRCAVPIAGEHSS